MATEEDDELLDAIADAAISPKRVQGDTGSTEMRPISEMIEADKYTRNKRAARTGLGGIKFVKLIPPDSE